MPLLVSPIDGQTPMQQIIRDGIEIDRCPVSGGVWLDRGELEKLLSAMQQAVTEDRGEYHSYRQSHAQPAPHSHKSYKYDDDDYEDYYKKKHGKKSKLNTILGMFD
jgi:Zn-finger nucleic acid-binding protein